MQYNHSCMHAFVTARFHKDRVDLNGICFVTRLKKVFFFSFHCIRFNACIFIDEYTQRIYLLSCTNTIISYTVYMYTHAFNMPLPTPLDF